MKKASIKMAILIPSLAVLVAGIIAMVAVVGVLSASTAQDLTQQLMDARVNEYTNEFRVLCRDVYGALTTATSIVSNYADPELNEEVTDPRDEVVRILSSTLLANPKIVTMWTCWEPNAFDGKDSEYANTSIYDATGRFALHVYEDGGGYNAGPIEGYDDPVEGEYYQGTRNSGKPYITDPYVCDVGGKDVIMYTLAIPILKNGKVAGAVGADINLQDVISMMNAGSILDDGYLFTLSPGGFIATHSNTDVLLNHYGTTWMKNYRTQFESILANGGSINTKAYSDVASSNVSFLATGVMIGDTGRYWAICGVVPEKTVNAASNTLLWTIIVIGLALIVVVGVTIFLIVRGRLKELPNLTATAEAISVGDIDSSIIDAGTENTKNEISLLGHAFSKMTAGIRQQADTLSRISQGDYSMTAPVRSDKDVMNQAINQMLDSTNQTLNQINAAATQVSAGSKQVADGAQSLAQGSTEQASAVEQLSASITQIATQTQNNAEQANTANKQAITIREDAHAGAVHMQQLMKAVQDINNASDNISKIIKVIDEIAFQTGILALNASVEAAHAGQAGKGFAVVADEVKVLATRSKDAAKETNTLIADSTRLAEEGVEIARQTENALTAITNSIAGIADVVAGIAAASTQQASAISQVNTGIHQVAQVVQQNSATAEESAAASQEMSGQSELLTQLTDQFKLKEQDHRSLPGESSSRKKAYTGPEENSYLSADKDGGFGKY